MLVFDENHVENKKYNEHNSWPYYFVFVASVECFQAEDQTCVRMKYIKRAYYLAVCSRIFQCYFSFMFCCRWSDGWGNYRSCSFALMDKNEHARPLKLENFKVGNVHYVPCTVLSAITL